VKNVLRVLAAVVALGCGPAFAKTQTEIYSGRDMLVHVPPGKPRALVIVLHGGLGNAERIERRRNEAGMNLDTLADKYDFVVAYLNGTPITRITDARVFGWNAGACCGMPTSNKIDDVGYITGAVNDLLSRYHISRDRAFVMGHSNGAMMALRMICETRTFAAAISISGALEASDTVCPAAKGARVLAIHGAADENVPVAGGDGAQGLLMFNYNSEAYTAKIFRGSGATYDLKVVPGADHALEAIDSALQKNDGLSIGDEAARFFGLANAR
jgi:poly(3-hydroxybutyrate) depolymerase